MDNLVSVIMSAYNAEKSLGRSIESILNQSYRKIEILIIQINAITNVDSVVSQKVRFL